MIPSIIEGEDDLLSENLLNEKSIPLEDEVGRISRLQMRYRSLKERVAQRKAANFWETAGIVERSSEIKKRIREDIASETPLCVGRIGSVEAVVMMWALNLRYPGSFLGLSRVGFWETMQGSTNAGIRPRNPDSYRLFGRLMRRALEEVDVLGCWRNVNEVAILESLNWKGDALIDVERLWPDLGDPQSWTVGLHGKRVLVVSPFTKSFESQYQRLREVWPDAGLVPSFELQGYQFPYLIDDQCGSDWLEVFRDVKKVVDRGEFDVALFGCGGIGLPLAAAAKRAGRVGVHMGGHLQLLFGVFGQRHQGVDWVARRINEYWVRPLAEEVPFSAERVEKGAYW